MRDRVDGSAGGPALPLRVSAITSRRVFLRRARHLRRDPKPITTAVFPVMGVVKIGSPLLPLVVSTSGILEFSMRRHRARVFGFLAVSDPRLLVSVSRQAASRRAGGYPAGAVVCIHLTAVRARGVSSRGAELIMSQPSSAHLRGCLRPSRRWTRRLSASSRWRFAAVDHFSSVMWKRRSLLLLSR